MPIPPIIFAFAAPVGFSCLDSMAAYMVNVVGMSIFHFMCFRNTTSSVVLVSYLLASGTPDAPLGPPGTRALLWARGVSMTMCLILVYTSMRYLTISEFWMINSCSPFPTAILCWFILKEKFTRIQGVCCVLSIAGVLLITNPLGPGTSSSVSTGGALDDNVPDDTIYKLLGIALAVPSIILVGIEVVIIRIIGDRVDHIQALATMAVVPAIITALVLLIGQLPLVWPSDLFDWIILLGTIPVAWLGIFTLTYAAQRLSGVTMIMTTYTGLVHSTVIQWMAYGNHPNIVTTGGMVVIASAGIVAAVYGQGQEEGSKTKTEDASTKEANAEDEWEEREDAVPLLTLSRAGQDRDDVQRA